MAEEQKYNFALVKKDLEATLLGDIEKNDGVSTLTIEEKLNLFPEFEGDKKLFNSVEKSVMANNDVLKKKDFVPLSYKRKEESNISQLETPSTLETTTTETDKSIKPSTMEVNVNTPVSNPITMEVNPGTEMVEPTELDDKTDESFTVENPLEDPNLTAGGTEEIQADVSTQLDKKEDENILGSKNNPVKGVPSVNEAEEGKYYQNLQNPDLNYIFHDGQYVGTETTFYKNFVSKDIEMPLSYNDWIIYDTPGVLSLDEINERRENPDKFGKTKEGYVSYFKEQTGIQGQFAEGSDVFIPKDYSNFEYPELEIRKDFHLGKPTEDIYQNMLDYPELIMYDFYSGDASTLFVPEDIVEEEVGYYGENSKFYYTNPAESTAPLGSGANPYNIDYGYESYGVDVNLNDILKSLNREINGEGYANWIPASERGYENANEMRTYGFGLDEQEIVFKYNEELGRNELYMTNFYFNEKGEKIYDEENEKLINTFTFKNNLKGTTRGDIYKGVVMQAYSLGIDLSEVPSDKMEYLLDAHYNKYKSFKSKYYQQMLQNLPESILDLEKGYEFEDIEGLIKEAKTGLIKDLVKNNIYVGSVIQGNTFEDYIQNNLYHDIRNNFVNDIYKVIEGNMGDEKQDETPGYYGVEGRLGGPMGIPRHESEIYRDAIETELEKEKYDWMGEAEKESLGALIMRKYKKEKSPEFQEIQQNKVNNAVEKYNQESEKINIAVETGSTYVKGGNELDGDNLLNEQASRITFIPPGENQSNLKNTLGPIIDDLRENKNFSEEDIDNYIKDVYGVDFNRATGVYEFTDKYKAAYGEIFGRAETETWKEWNANNPEWNQKNIMAEAWEQTITAWVLGEMGVDTKNADYDVEYGWWEEHVFIPTLSIVTDPVTYGTGYGGSFIAKTAFGGVRSRLVSNMAVYEQKLIAGGMTPSAARTTVSAKFGESYNRINNMQNVVGSGLGLSSYTTSAEVMMYADENFQDFKTTELLKNGLVNFTLGGGIGHLGNLTRDASARLNAYYGKTSRQFKLTDGVYTIDDRINPIGVGNEIMLRTTKAGMYTGALGVEAGAFAVAHYDSSISAEENFARSFSLIFGLKTVNAPMKLMKKKTEGRVKVNTDFQLTEADILTLRSNGKFMEGFENYDLSKPLSKKEMQKLSKEYFNFLEKEFKENLSTNENGEMSVEGVNRMTQIINSMPLNVQYKYLDAKNYRVEFSEIDALPHEVGEYTRVVDGVSKTFLQFKDFEGNVIETRDIKDIAEISSGGMSVGEYKEFVSKQSFERMAEIYANDKVFIQELDKNLKSYGITKTEYDNWLKGRYKKGGKYENKELQDGITDIVELTSFEKRYSEKKALDKFNTVTLEKAINNLKERGVNNPSADAIANECMSVINRVKIEQERINKVNSEINNANEKHNEALDNNQFIQGHEKDGVIYNNPVEGSRPVTTNITKENSINLGTVRGKELSKDHKKTLIYELEKKGELTQELKDAITEVKDFDSFVKLVTERTGYESIIFKNEIQLLEKAIQGKENNSAISTSKEKNVITDREVTESDILSKDNYENLLSQAETPTQRQLLEDGLRVLNKGGEVVIHNKVESFNKVLEKDGTKVDQKGYEGSAYVDSKGVIHINKNTQRGLGDIYHEWKHLEFRKMKKTNPELYNKLLNETNELLKNEGVLVDIKQIVKEYKVNEKDVVIKEGETKEDAIKRATKELQLEEATIRIAEALRSGSLSEKDIAAIKNSKVVDGVKTTLNNMFEKMGVEYRLETNPEVISFLENHIKSFEKIDVKSEPTKTTETTPGEGQLKLKQAPYDYQGNVTENKIKEKEKEILEVNTGNPEIDKGVVTFSGTFDQGFETKIGTTEKGNNKDQRGEKQYVEEVKKAGESEMYFNETVTQDGRKIFSLVNPSHRDRLGRAGFYQVSMSYEKGSKITLEDVKGELTNKMNIVNKEIYGDSYKEIKTETTTQGEVKTTIETAPEPKRLETLVKELETLKEQGAEQSLIDAKQVEVNQARVRQAQAETGQVETKPTETKTETTTETTKSGETSEVVQIFNESKQLLENVNLNQYSERTIELIDNLKDVAILEGSPVSTEIAVELNNIVTSINNGTATPKQINDAYVKINALEKSEPIINGLKESIEKHGGKFRFLTGLTTDNVRIGKFGGIEVDNLNMLKRDLSTQNLSMLESYFFMEKDGLLTKNIVGPMQEAHVKYTMSVRDGLTNWFDKTKFNIEKVPFAGRTQRKNSMTKLGLLLAQRERNGIDGKNVWLEIKNGSDGGGSYLRGYSKSEIKLLDKIYESLPKDKNGNIDMTKAFEGLSVKEREIIEVYESMMTNLKEKQKVTNQINDIEFTEVDNYFPHINKTRYDKNNQEITGNLSDKDFLDNLYTNQNTKILSDRGKQRTADGVLPIEFNLDKVMHNSILQINRDYVYTPVGKEVNGLLDNMKLETNPDGVNLAINGIQDRLKESVKVQLHQHNGFGTTVMGNLFNVNYATQLVSARRLFFVEPTVETARIGLTRSFKEYPDFVKQFIAGSNRRIQQVTSVGERLHDVPLNTSLDIMKRTNSTGLLKNDRIGMEYESPGGVNTLQSANNYLLGMVDRMQMNLIWMPAFKSEFNKSGIKFNVKEYESNPDAYFKQHSKIFKEASRIADRQLNMWKNESTKGGKRSKIDILGLTTLDATSGWAPIMTYMSNFGAQEVAMLNRSLKNIVRGDNTSRTLAVREMVGIFGSGVMYGTLSGVAYGWQQYYLERTLLENQLGQPDKYNESDILQQIHNLDLKWEDEYKKLTDSDAITKEFITNGIFLTNSKYSQAVKMVFGGTLGITQKFMDSPDEWREAGGNWGIYADFRDYTNQLFQDATYAKVPRNPDDVIMSALPQIEMAWEIFAQEAPKAVIDYLDRGVYEADFEEKYREDINFYNFLNTSMKTLLFTQGKALPFQKDLDAIGQSFYNFYNVDTEKVLKEFEMLERQGVGEPYSDESEDYDDGSEDYDDGSAPYSIMDIEDRYVDDDKKTTQEKKKEKEKRGVHYIEIGNEKEITLEEYNNKFGGYKWWNKTDDEIKTDWTKEELRQMLPRHRFQRLFPY